MTNIRSDPRLANMVAGALLARGFMVEDVCQRPADGMATASVAFQWPKGKRLSTGIVQDVSEALAERLEKRKRGRWRVWAVRRWDPVHGYVAEVVAYVTRGPAGGAR